MWLNVLCLKKGMEIRRAKKSIEMREKLKAQKQMYICTYVCYMHTMYASKYTADAAVENLHKWLCRNIQALKKKNNK